MSRNKRQISTTISEPFYRYVKKNKIKYSTALARGIRAMKNNEDVNYYRKELKILNKKLDKILEELRCLKGKLE